MRKIFEFTMPDDSDDYKIYSQALKMHSILYELSNELRSCYKYEKTTKRDLHWRDRLNELLTEYGVELI